MTRVEQLSRYVAGLRSEICSRRYFTAKGCHRAVGCALGGYGVNLSVSRALRRCSQQRAGRADRGRRKPTSVDLHNLQMA